MQLCCKAPKTGTRALPNAEGRRPEAQPRMTARARREIALLLLGMQAAVLGQSPAPTRYAPNGHTLDAADFLSELGERSLRCSACELVAERMDYMIPLLVRTWPTRSSAMTQPTLHASAALPIEAHMRTSGARYHRLCT